MSEGILLSRFSFSDSRNSPLNATSVAPLQALLGLSVYTVSLSIALCLYVSFVFLLFLFLILCSAWPLLVSLPPPLLSGQSWFYCWFEGIIYIQHCSFYLWDSSLAHFHSLFFYLFDVGFVHSNKFILSLIYASHYFDASLKGYGMVLNFTYLFLSVFILVIVYFLKWFGILTYSILLGGDVLVSAFCLSFLLCKLASTLLVTLKRYYNGCFSYVLSCITTEIIESVGKLEDAFVGS